MNKIKEFWNTKHEINVTKGLTGSHLQEYMIYMNIKKFIKKDNKVLNIGVGLGYCTKELVDEGMLVDVLDISEKAIEKVKGITQSQFLTTDLEKLPKGKYDLVISHLVNQHMNDKDLINQIKHVLPSLKKDGVFAMQFAFVEGVDYEAEHDNLETLHRQQTGGVIRLLSNMEKIVEKSKGRISWISDVRHHNPPITSKWQYIHIQKLEE